MNEQPSLSLVIPVYDEEENVGDLYENVIAALEPAGYEFHVIFVDDGSKDGSLAVLESLAEKDERVVVVALRRNFGQTAAMAAGIDASEGSLIVFLDADGQNDPSDIPKMVAKMDEGYDLVSGYREHRQDPFLTRILPSRIANWIIRGVTGVRLRDYGCSLKVYRADLLKSFRLYGEMHRFIPAHCSWIGARMAELPVLHHPRTKGVSKYGLGRTFKVVLDLAVVKFLSSYSTKPIYVFGSASLISGSLGLLFWVITLYRYFALNRSTVTPMILGALFMGGLSVQFFLMGLIAEMLTRTYHESQQKPIYFLKGAGFQPTVAGAASSKPVPTPGVAQSA